MKKWLCALLAAVLLTLCCAPALAFQSDLADGLGDFSASGDGNLDKYPEPVRIKIGMGVNLSMQFPGDDDHSNNVWSRAYADELGINLELAYSTGVSSDKINAMIASGDIPDLLVVNQYQLKMLSNSGLIRGGLHDLYRDNACEGYRQLVEGLCKNAAIAQSTYNGDMMAFPIVNSSAGEEAPVLWLRTDWMQKLGLENPNNWQELVEILRAFVTKDPDGNGASDTVGISFTKDLWDTGYQLDGLFNAFGSFPQSEFWVHNPADPAKLSYGAFQPETREALVALAGLYKEGLIDPQFAANDGTAAGQLLANGKCGALVGAPWMSVTLRASVENEPDADWRALPIPGLEGPTTRVTAEYPIGSYVVFAKDFEHPEAFIKMVNLQFSKCYSEDSTMDTYWEYIQNQDSSISAFQIYPWGTILPVLKNEMAADEIVNMQLPTDQVDVWGRPFAMFVDEFKAGNSAMWYWYRFFGPEGGHTITTRYTRENLYQFNAFYGPDTDTMVENMSLITDLVNEMVVKIIMGEEDIQAFDTYKQQAEALGLNQMAEEAAAWLQQNQG